MLTLQASSRPVHLPYLFPIVFSIRQPYLCFIAVLVCSPRSVQAAGGVNVVIKAALASVLLQDPFHIPLLEVCLGAGARAASVGPDAVM